MNIQGLDKELCERRNRVAARKEEVEGVPVRLFANTEQAMMTAADFQVTEYVGAMPTDAEDALSAINSKLPEGSAELTADDVYIHYLEAANGNFIGDRYMFLAESTLRNIAEDAASGFAFMNSHRTGSVSQPSELPFGKTFAGQYQAGMDQQGRKRRRAMVAFYMLRGVRPNGENGPTTDDLHRMILAGQVADVSVGLTQGQALCDICGANLRETDCPHVPGTHRSMTEDEMARQRDKGVADGRCSYTLENARCGEVSAVYDGAVPGAGVKKVMSLRRKGKLNHREWKQARAVFGSLLNGDLSMDQDIFAEVADAVETGVRNALAGSSGVSGQAVIRPSEPAASLEIKQEGVEKMNEKDMPVVPADSAGTELFAELNSQLATLREELQASKRAQEAQAAELAKLSERNARLEAEAMDMRFTAEVEGTVQDGVRWIGDHAKHKSMLSKLASAFGEQSPELAQYIETNRTYARQLGASEILKEYGRDGDGNQLTALEELQKAASDLQAINPKLTAAVAFDQACQQNPAIYERYCDEQRGRK